MYLVGEKLQEDLRKPYVVNFTRKVSNFQKMYRVKVGLAQLGLSGEKLKLPITNN